MFVCCECCVLSGRGLRDGLITRPEESYWLWHVVVWSRNLENEDAKARYWAVENTITMGCNARKTNNNCYSWANLHCQIIELLPWLQVFTVICLRLLVSFSTLF
jgi:hypothetical protein